NGEYRRIGGITNLTSNVRVIGASNRNLLEETSNKNFRRDLLFRLNVITLIIPPLRERREDILLLANHFLGVKSPIRSPKKLSAEAEKALLKYDFPGNVRELEHIIERAIIFAENDHIEPEDLNLPLDTLKGMAQKAHKLQEDEEVLSLAEIERRQIEHALQINHWDRALTAFQLGISPKTLYSKIKKYELREV
ncbi:MAG: helix-turn-helix domain-containing protein, partial [Ignavibacteriaceae bacterium]|nr:helix-turn-helix domain-containing protein [Ignavibacteriaceae bacterium]